MDSEATVILQQPSGAYGMTAVTTPSRTSRTESTAVFVGRASFQMIPALHTRRQMRAVAPVEPLVKATPPPTVMVVENPMTPPPVIVEPQAVPVLRQAASSGTVLRLFSPGEVTEPIQTRARSPRARSLVTPRAMRTIVMALVAGATLTLSAEAMMRRPGTVEALKVLAPARAPLATPVAVATVAAAPTAAITTAPVPTVPTVVASTATVAPAEPAMRPAPLRAKRQRPRATHGNAGRPLAVATAHRQRTTETTPWVDPFAAPAMPPSSKAAASKTSAATWVDPFAN